MTRKSKGLTRFERVAPPPPKKKEPTAKKPRKPRSPPDQWVRDARERAAWPFVYETSHLTHDEVEPDDDEVCYQPKFVEREVTTRTVGLNVHTSIKQAVENALTQAYITGYVQAVNYLDVLPFIVRQYSKNKKLLKEVSELIARMKDDLRTGRRHF